MRISTPRTPLSGLRHRALRRTPHSNSSRSPGNGQLTGWRRWERIANNSGRNVNGQSARRKGSEEAALAGGELVHSERRYFRVLRRLLMALRRAREMLDVRCRRARVLAWVLKGIVWDVQQLLAVSSSLGPLVRHLDLAPSAAVSVLRQRCWRAYRSYVSAYGTRIPFLLRSLAHLNIDIDLGNPGPDLGSALIAPVQRLPRYHLLMRRIANAARRYSAEIDDDGNDGEDLGDADAACEAMASLLDALNAVPPPLLFGFATDADDDDGHECWPRVWRGRTVVAAARAERLDHCGVSAEPTLLLRTGAGMVLLPLAGADWCSGSVVEIRADDLHAAEVGDTVVLTSGADPASMYCLRVRHRYLRQQLLPDSSSQTAGPDPWSVHGWLPLWNAWRGDSALANATQWTVVDHDSSGSSISYHGVRIALGGTLQLGPSGGIDAVDIRNVRLTLAAPLDDDDDDDSAAQFDAVPEKRTRVPWRRRRRRNSRRPQSSGKCGSARGGTRWSVDVAVRGGRWLRCTPETEMFGTDVDVEVEADGLDVVWCEMLRAALEGLVVTRRPPAARSLLSGVETASVSLQCSTTSSHRPRLLPALTGSVVHPLMTVTSPRSAGDTGYGGGSCGVEAVLAQSGSGVTISTRGSHVPLRSGTPFGSAQHLGSATLSLPGSGDRDEYSEDDSCSDCMREVSVTFLGGECGEVLAHCVVLDTSGGIAEVSVAPVHFGVHSDDANATGRNTKDFQRVTRIAVAAGNDGSDMLYAVTGSGRLYSGRVSAVSREKNGFDVSVRVDRMVYVWTGGHRVYDLCTTRQQLLALTHHHSPLSSSLVALGKSSSGTFDPRDADADVQFEVVGTVPYGEMRMWVSSDSEWVILAPKHQPQTSAVTVYEYTRSRAFPEAFGRLRCHEVPVAFPAPTTLASTRWSVVDICSTGQCIVVALCASCGHTTCNSNPPGSGFHDGDLCSKSSSAVYSECTAERWCWRVVQYLHGDTGAQTLQTLLGHDQSPLRPVAVVPGSGRDDVVVTLAAR